MMYKILDMNGSVTSSVSFNTTHVIASHGVNEKVFQARNLGIPVMRLEFIEAVWEACQTDPYAHAQQDQFNSYLCPLFHKVQFAISTLIPKDVSNSLRINILNNGMTYLLFDYSLCCNLLQFLALNLFNFIIFQVANCPANYKPSCLFILPLHLSTLCTLQRKTYAFR